MCRIGLWRGYLGRAVFCSDARGGGGGGGIWRGDVANVGMTCGRPPGGVRNVGQWQLSQVKMLA